MRVRDRNNTPTPCSPYAAPGRIPPVDEDPGLSVTSGRRRPPPPHPQRQRAHATRALVAPPGGTSCPHGARTSARASYFLVPPDPPICPPSRHRRPQPGQSFLAVSSPICVSLSVFDGPALIPPPPPLVIPRSLPPESCASHVCEPGRLQPRPPRLGCSSTPRGCRRRAKCTRGGKCGRSAPSW